MRSFLRIIVLGLLLWVALFAVGGAGYLLKKTAYPESFESLMTIAVTTLTVLATAMLFRKVERNFMAIGVIAGILWVAINVALDVPLFILLQTPMKKTWQHYVADIGLTYLALPAIPIGVAALLRMKTAATKESSAPPVSNPFSPAASTPRPPAPMSPASPVATPKN